jgi:uncharacterized membrane protein (DUF2068 family)
MTAPTTNLAARHPVVFEPLRWFGAYRLVRGTLALAGAIVLFRLMHRDLPATALHWMHRLRIEADSRLGEFILRKAVDIPKARIGYAALFLLGYMLISFIEGLGLIFRQTWAEWLTVFTTFSLVPLEFLELKRHPHWTRVIVLVLNVLMVAYLIVRLKRDRTRASRRALDRAALAETLAATPNQEGKA